MNTSDLKGKKITVMGIGLHGGGAGIVKFLSEAGARIIATDLKSQEELQASLDKLKGIKNVSYVFGQHRSEDFTAVDMVIKNPVVPWTNKYIQMALEKNIPVEIDSSLFFKLCKNPIIGITGTKGKTTTSSLIHEVLKKAGKNPVKVGVGQSSVLDKLNQLKKESIVVFELSSWRLSALGKFGFSPQVAVITNIFPDHLNYYKGMAEYIQDKKYIFSSQKKEDFCVLNWDDEEIRKMEGEVKSQLIKFSLKSNPGNQSVFLKDESIYFNDGNDEKEILETKDIKIPGKHNLGNILAAVAVGMALKISPEEIKEALIEFKGLAHRLEFVREIDGVKYFNDTTATNPGSAVAGIDSFSEPIVLIAGGSEKNLDTAELSRVILEKTKNAVFLKGESTNKILENIKKINPEKNYPIANSMQEAVEKARDLAENGDVVLLSPGAASFGMFLNEFDRGDKFKEAVEELK